YTTLFRSLPALHARGGIRAAGVLADEIGQALALDGLVVDVEQAFPHLNAVARQADHALDVIGGVVLRQAEHHDVTPVRLRAEDAAREQRRRQWNGIVAIAVGIFRDEQVIAHQQRRLHRSRGDVEGLEQKGTDHERDQESVDDDADGFTQAAFRFCAGGHAHRFPNSRRPLPARWQNVFRTRIAWYVRVRKMVSILILKAYSGATLNRPWLEHVVRGVLDGCSWARNQAPRQNLIIH